MPRGSNGIRQRVGLVKTDGVLGPEPVGARYEYLSSIDMPREEAVRRAYRLFKREHPDENSMCWTVEGEGGS